MLLERLIVNRPHPWGLLITFLEIIKNPRYNFWQNSFTKSDPDLKRLFDSVSRTCMVPVRVTLAGFLALCSRSTRSGSSLS